MKSKRPVIRLKNREGRRVKSGAPWVFANELALEAPVKALPPGTQVELADADGSLIGAGYFNLKSLIAVRLLGASGTAFDQAFFAGRLRHALALRNAFFNEPYYRLIHAEGDLLPGVVVDRFGDTVVVQITTAGMDRLTDIFLAALDEVITPACVILRNDTPARTLESLESYVRVAKGDAPSQLTVKENGALYLADPQGGQKSGWYYDQRDNRRFIAELARGKRVLDAYCYSGGFGVLAAVQGAAHMTGIDSSAPALDLSRAAAQANNVDARCTFKKAEVFVELEHLAQTSERFDIVIADPPPFAPSRKDIETGARAYRKLARLSASLVAPGGYLMLASCSHNMAAERFALECAAGIGRAGRSARLIRQAGAGPDHPVHPMLLETAYLKALAYAVD